MRIAYGIRKWPWAGLQKNLPKEKNQENNSSGLSAGVFLRSSLCDFAVKTKNRRDTKKNQENNSCSSSAGAFPRSSLRDFAVK